MHVCGRWISVPIVLVGALLLFDAKPAMAQTSCDASGSNRFIALVDNAGVLQCTNQSSVPASGTACIDVNFVFGNVSQRMFFGISNGTTCEGTAFSTPPTDDGVACNTSTQCSIPIPGVGSVMAFADTTTLGSFGTLSFTTQLGVGDAFIVGTISTTAGGPAPEIAVSSSEGGAIADAGTDAQGSEPAGTAKIVTYTVTNTGTDTLTITGTPTVSNTSNITGTPSVTAPLSSTVAASGGTTTFTVTYTPTSAGAFSFDLDIVNDDADENPYDIAVSGTATGAPEIAVSSSEGGAVADAGTDAQGSEAAGTAKIVTYTVTNTGTDTLTITGTPTVSNTSNITGTPSVTAPLSSTVAASGGTTTFTVTYTPTSAGAFSFDLDIVNDDADEANYDILVSGTGLTTDAIPPDVAITAPTSTNGPYTTTFTFTEPVNGFALTDIVVGNGTANAPFTGSDGDAVFTALITPISQGATTAVTIDVAAGVAQDLAGNNNTVAPQATTNFIDEDFVRSRTQRTIANFMGGRADQITVNDPDIINRLNGGATGGGGTGGPAGFAAEARLRTTSCHSPPASGRLWVPLRRPKTNAAKSLAR